MRSYNPQGEGSILSSILAQCRSTIYANKCFRLSNDIFLRSFFHPLPTRHTSRITPFLAPQFTLLPTLLACHRALSYSFFYDHRHFLRFMGNIKSYCAKFLLDLRSTSPAAVPI